MSKDPRQTFPASGVRVISGMQHLVNPETGEKLLDVEDLEHALVKHATIRRWAFIVHEGSHVHWVAATFSPTETRRGKQVPRRTWARWFGVPEDRIWRVLGGEDGLADVLIYLLHEGAAGQGKQHYSHDDMHASAGWDWESLVRSRQTALAVSGPGPGPRRQLSLRGRMLKEGLSYREARAQSTVAEEKLRALRHEYLNSTTAPRTHTNIYIQAPVSAERSALARMVATQLAGTENQVFSVDAQWWRTYDGERVLTVSADDGPGSLIGDRCFPREADLAGALAHDGAAPVDITERWWDGEDWHTCYTRLHHTATVIVSRQPLADFQRDLRQLYAKRVRPQLATVSSVQMSLPIFLPVSADQIGVQILGRYADGAADSTTEAYVHWATIKNRLSDLRALPQGPRRLSLERCQVEPVLAARDEVIEAQHRDDVRNESEIFEMLSDPSAWEV